MTNEDNKVDNQVEGMDNTQEESNDNKYTAFEQKCMSLGWSPEGKKSAEDWSLDGLSVRNEKITDLYKITDNLKTLMSKQEKTMYEKARKEFEAERDAAIARGDVQHVKDMERQEQEQRIQNEISQHVQNFTSKNADWFYGSSYEALKMQKVCKEMDAQLATQQMPAEKHFEALENYMRGEFPNYFSTKESSKKASQVEGSSSGVVRTSSKTNYTFEDLNEDQKKFARLYEKQKIMTIKQYIEEQVKAGNLK